MEPMGEGSNIVYILFEYRTDFKAVNSRMNVYLPPMKVGRLLEECGGAKCENHHSHTCALSIVGDATFGDVLVYVSARVLVCTFAR